MTIDKNHKYYNNFVDYCKELAIIEADLDDMDSNIDIEDLFNKMVNNEAEFNDYIEGIEQ